MVSLIFLLFLFPLVSAAIDSGAPTQEEWKDILAVQNTSDDNVGLELTLSVIPESYYQSNGTTLNISGRLSDYFGEIPDAGIIIQKETESGESYLNATTDMNGSYLLNDTISQIGHIRYQARYPYTNLQKLSDNVTSRMLELSGISTPANASLSLQDTTSEESDPSRTVTLQQGGNFSGPDLSLTVNASEYLSGQNITLSGRLSDKGKPLENQIVTITAYNTSTDTNWIIGKELTNPDGSYTQSVHIAGPDSYQIQAESFGSGLNYSARSSRIMLPFVPLNFTPDIREIPEKRQISLALHPGSASVGDEIQVRGWYSDGEGNGIPYTKVYLYSVNSRMKGEKYQDTPAVTNRDGYYAFSVQAPEKPGNYLLAVGDPGLIGKDTLFSNIAILHLNSEAGTQVSRIFTNLSLKSEPPMLKPEESAQISIFLQNMNGDGIAGEPVRILFSEDGFTWYVNGKGDVPTDTNGMITLTDAPKKAGVHYYRAVYNGSESYASAESDLLILPVLPSSDENQNQEIRNQTS